MKHCKILFLSSAITLFSATNAVLEFIVPQNIAIGLETTIKWAGEPSLGISEQAVVLSKDGKSLATLCQGLISGSGECTFTLSENDVPTRMLGNDGYYLELQDQDGLTLDVSKNFNIMSDNVQAEGQQQGPEDDEEEEDEDSNIQEKKKKKKSKKRKNENVNQEHTRRNEVGKEQEEKNSRKQDHINQERYRGKGTASVKKYSRRSEMDSDDHKKSDGHNQAPQAEDARRKEQELGSRAAVSHKAASSAFVVATPTLVSAGSVVHDPVAHSAVTVKTDQLSMGHEKNSTGKGGKQNKPIEINGDNDKNKTKDKKDEKTQRGKEIKKGAEVKEPKDDQRSNKDEVWTRVVNGVSSLSKNFGSVVSNGVTKIKSLIIADSFPTAGRCHC
ncbi:hypothetical protein BGZ54_000931 [Gamsiella multidivaricata]|nr:hypothetical protein BGZ54_000931 [Gamsiella multidivaricata]